MVFLKGMGGVAILAYVIFLICILFFEGISFYGNQRREARGLQSPVGGLGVRWGRDIRILM